MGKTMLAEKTCVAWFFVERPLRFLFHASLPAGVKVKRFAERVASDVRGAVVACLRVYLRMWSRG